VPVVVLQTWAAPDLTAARTALAAVLDELYAARAVALPAGVLVRVAAIAEPTVLPDESVPAAIHRITASVQLAIFEARTGPVDR
jgi:hypothetical protein